MILVDSQAEEAKLTIVSPWLVVVAGGAEAEVDP